MSTTHPRVLGGIIVSALFLTIAVAIAPQPRIAAQSPPVGGTWSSLTQGSPVSVDLCLLLTDGAVFCHQYGSRNWYRLTPTNTGSYLAGTWSFDSSMQAGYAPLYFASAVLPDGRVIIEGGEYNCNPSCSANWQAQGSIYDPLTHTWTAVLPPAGWSRIGDAQSVVLADGTFMLASCCSGQFALFNPITLGWTAVQSVQQDNYNNEEGLTLLADGTVLSVDAWTNPERYELFNPITGLWTSPGTTPVVLTDDTGSKEQGPGVLRADGTVFYFGAKGGAAGHTAIYNTASHTWTAGPNFPNGDNTADAPAALLPNGNVLVHASPNIFQTPSRWYEVDKTTNAFVQVASPGYAASVTSFQGAMLLLPTGQVLQTVQSSNIQLYTPTGTYDLAWQPTITNVPSSVHAGSTYSISGTQFNGMSQGSFYGDENESPSNYPLVRITNQATGHVFYARTHDHSSMGVATGSLTVSTSFDVSVDTELGASDIEVVANGIPSAKTTITVLAGSPDFGKLSPANNATGQSTTLTLKWATSSGATSYEYCLDTSNDNACDGSWINVGSSKSVGVAGLQESTSYYWQVRAQSGVTTEADSATWWTFTTTSAPPGPFSKISPSNGSNGQSMSPTLSWGASANATSYEYCIDTVNNALCDGTWTSVGNATSVGVSGLASNVKHYWQVRAKAGAATTDANGGTWWSFTTAQLPNSFNKSSPATGAIGQSTSPTLKWGGSGGATSYEYCIDTTNDALCGGVWTSVGNVTTVVASGLSAATPYFWQVRSRNGAGTREANAGVWWTFTTGAGLGAFNKVSPSNGANTRPVNPTLTWGSSSGATSYEYCIDTVNNTSCDTGWTSVGNAISVGLSGLTPNIKYFWQVRARNALGTLDANGGTWWAFTTAKLPSAFNKSSPADNATGLSTTVTLTWGSSSNATSFEYCVDTVNNNSCDTGWTTTGTAKTVQKSGLAPGTQYYWQVRAVSGAGTTEANAGTWWTFTTQ